MCTSIIFDFEKFIAGEVCTWMFLSNWIDPCVCITELRAWQLHIQIPFPTNPLTTSPNCSTWADPPLYSFSIAVTPNENLNIFSSASLSVPPSPNPTSDQVSLPPCKPFLFFLLLLFCHKSALTLMFLPCLDFFLHLSYALSMSLDVWPQVFKLINLHYFY